VRILYIILLLHSSLKIIAQTYPDQLFSYKENELISRISNHNGTEISSDGKYIQLIDGINTGSVIFEPDSSEHPFDRGLPSWNGTAWGSSSAFKVQMRFFNNGWSPWLTVGYWKANLWPDYGTTDYSGGYIDIDYVKLYSFHSKWQFQILMKRTGAWIQSPTIKKLSFFISDENTTQNINYSVLLNDNPPEIFIPTDHYYQYSLDPDIGDQICSPTSVSMVLRSYDIEVEPVQFARDTYDSYWGIFGIWPRVVQNASEFGLDGAVTRYRNWSEAQKVLKAGGRIVISVGLPLYAGHLMMLAGFDNEGFPLIHDPARSNGYGYKFNKNALAESWFGKGGVAYTFYKNDSTGITSVEEFADKLENFYLLRNFPNPFNPSTTFLFNNIKQDFITIKVYDITGREIVNLYNDIMNKGEHSIVWNAGNLPSGNYFINVRGEWVNKTLKVLLLK